MNTQNINTEIYFFRTCCKVENQKLYSFQTTPLLLLTIPGSMRKPAFIFLYGIGNYSQVIVKLNGMRGILKRFIKAVDGVIGSSFIFFRTSIECL